MSLVRRLNRVDRVGRLERRAACDLRGAARVGVVAADEAAQPANARGEAFKLLTAARKRVNAAARVDQVGRRLDDRR